MKQERFAAFVLSIVLFACGFDKDRRLQEESLLSADLIHVVIDSTLSLDPGLNTGDYYFDPGILESVDKRSLEVFLKKTPTKLTNLDSLFEADSNWINHGFFIDPVIRFEQILVEKDGSILTRTWKYKASDGSIGTEVIFKRSGRKYKCIKSEITWIS